MTKPDDFIRALERLEVPKVGEVRHQEYVRRVILSAPRSAALTLWYVLIPSYILLCALMKAVFGMEPHLFAVFDGVVRELGASPLGQALPALLLLGLPMLAVLLNLVVLARLWRAAGRGSWHVAVRRQPLNLLIVILGLLVSGLYVVYLLLRA